jgi:uncharacterized protein (DUF4415 family)
MSEQSENIVNVTLMRSKPCAGGEGRTDWAMSQDEAMPGAAPASLTYDGWQKTVTVEMPERKEQVTLRLDRDLLPLFLAHSRGYQIRIKRHPARLL